jgi:hypothetical protein
MAVGSARSFNGPYLKGEPRVHYNDLRESEGEDDETVLYLEEQLFSGIAWRQLAGRLTENTIVNGLRHGRCAEFYLGGQVAVDGVYHEGCPVGEHRTWYETGVLRAYTLYDDQWNDRLVRRYYETGQLAFEFDSDTRTRRHWYKDGTLLCEWAGASAITSYYAPDGRPAIRETRDDTWAFDGDVLYEHAMAMLAYRDIHMDRPFYRWLQTQLDQGESRALLLLLGLTDHVRVAVAETALSIIGHRGCQEAIPIVQKLTSSTRRKPEGEGGFACTLAEMAADTLVRLTLPEDRQEVAFEVLKEQQRAREQAEEEAHRSRQLSWPLTTAKFVKRLMGKSTLRNGGQLFSSEYEARSVDYIHVYEYEVGGAVYRACVWTKDADTVPEATVRVHFNPEKPSEHANPADGTCSRNR